MLSAAEIRLQQEKRVESRYLSDIHVAGKQHFRAVHYVADSQPVSVVKSMAYPITYNENVALAYHAPLAVDDVLSTAVEYGHKLVEILVPVYEKRDVMRAKLHEQRETLVIREIAEFHVIHCSTSRIFNIFSTDKRAKNHLRPQFYFM